MTATLQIDVTLQSFFGVLDPTLVNMYAKRQQLYVTSCHICATYEYACEIAQICYVFGRLNVHIFAIYEVTDISHLTRT